MASSRDQRRGSIPVAGDRPGGGARHGLTPKQIASIAHRQRGLCPICLRPLPAVPLVDHDHALAALHGHDPRRGCPRCVRSLLCGPCNLMLGNAQDDPARLRAGAAYLDMWYDGRRSPRESVASTTPAGSEHA